MLNVRFKRLGFSLVELLIGVVILGILSALAVPSFNTWIKSTQIRNAAESIQNGLQRARSSAVGLNTNVALTLGTGSSWSVSSVNPASAIDSRSSTEGSKDVTVTVTPVGATTVTFNNFGGVAANADASLPFTQVDLAAAGSSQNLRVTIGIGGNTRMCDPNIATGTSPRAC